MPLALAMAQQLSPEWMVTDLAQSSRATLGMATLLKVGLAMAGAARERNPKRATDLATILAVLIC